MSGQPNKAIEKIPSIEPPIPQARTEQLVIQELPDEVLVYDLDRHKAHCLNHTAALVWKHCDGQTSVGEIAQRLEQELHTSVDEDVVWLALNQLDKAHLLSERVNGPGAEGRVSRREVMRRLGWAAAVALPLVTTIVVPTVSQAQSCVALGGICSGSTPPCCPGLTCSLGHCEMLPP